MIILTLGLNVTTAVSGTAVRVVHSLRPKYVVQLIGSGTYTAAVQGSLDGTNWFALASKTASEVFEVSVVPYLRLVTSGMAGANVTVYALA